VATDWKEQLELVADATRGQLARPRAVLAEDVRTDDPALASWRAALREVCWHAEPHAFAHARPDELAIDAAPDACAIAAHHGARRALLALDAAELEAWAGVAALSVDAERGAHAELALLFVDVARGPSGRAADRGALSQRGVELAARAIRERIADVAIEATTLAALAALLDDDLEAATRHARRASRMAQSEGLPQQEYLAHVVLARVRRDNGASHFATRILRSLAGVVGRPWHGWLRWELLLAGGPRSHAELAPVRVEGSAFDALSAQLSRTLDGLAAGAAPLVREGLLGLRASSAGWAHLAPEAIDLAAALDAREDLGPASARLGAWARGEVALAPRGLHGLGAEIAGDEVDAVMVWAPVGAPARRLLTAARCTIGGPTDAHGGAPALVELQRSRRYRGRSETALAAVALAGGSLGDTELFATVYGFPYEAALHATVFGVLLHRIRERLGEAGTLVREGDLVVLRASAPMTIADPRCTRLTDDSVLHVFARQGALSAKDAAQQLALPLRTVQAVLQQLADEGAVRAVKQGRNVAYVVEDTTFSEPTRA
jgi:hypothetical protein